MSLTNDQMPLINLYDVVKIVSVVDVDCKCCKEIAYEGRMHFSTSENSKGRMPNDAYEALASWFHMT